MRKSDTWKQAGSLSLWRYEPRDRNYPGWHLSADRAGSESFAGLLDALAADGPEAHRSITLSVPPLYALPDHHKSGGWVTMPKVEVSIAGSPDAWPFVVGVEANRLSVGADWARSLKEGVLAIHQGKTDYSIGPRGRGNEPLWFW
jgi:hypothetical protein